MKVIFVCVWDVIIYTCIINVCQIYLSSLVSREYKNILFYFKCEIKNKQPFENM